jgi:hypothetical protein
VGAQRYLTLGVGGVLRDATRPPGREPLSPERIAMIVEMTLRTKPTHATHWTTRTMAKTAGISEAMVRRIWHQHGLQPHRVDRFKQSKDPRFVEKLRDIVGLYLHPPSCSPWTRKAISKRWTARGRSWRCNRTSPSGKRTITFGTARRRCLRRCACSMAW